MHSTDHPESMPLGEKIKPAPVPVEPRPVTRDGTVMQGADGRLYTNAPTP